jgi:hypothetical protein
MFGEGWRGQTHGRRRDGGRCASSATGAMRSHELFRIEFKMSFDERGQAEDCAFAVSESCKRVMCRQCGSDRACCNSASRVSDARRPRLHWPLLHEFFRHGPPTYTPTFGNPQSQHQISQCTPHCIDPPARSNLPKHEASQLKTSEIALATTRFVHGRRRHPRGSAKRAAVQVVEADEGCSINQGCGGLCAADNQGDDYSGGRRTESMRKRARQ